MAYRNYALFRKTSGKTKLVSLKQSLKNTVSKFKFFCFQGSYITSMVKIVPTPYDATITLTSDGFSQFGNSIIVQKGREVSVKVEKDGYVPYETTIITGEQDYTLEISLDKNIQFDFVINTSLNTTDVNDTTYIVPFTPGTYTSLKNKPLVIGWGDGSETTITDGVITQENCSHTYKTAGMYTISITSDTQTMPEISFYDNYKDINNNALKFLGTNSSMLLMVDENGNSITSSDNLFKDCVNLNAVSRDLFKYNSQLVDLNSCFENCSKMKTLGYDFMYYVPNLITASNMFKNCDGISTIPYGFLKLNTELLDCSGMFNDCDNLVSTPNNLFFNNKKIVNYSECFRNCEKLTYNRYIFGEDYSHLGNVSNPNFSYMFYRESFTGTNTGFAPEIWDVVVTPLEYSQQCFGEYMCNETLENYWRIPEEWGGPDRISVTMNIDDGLSTVLYDYNIFELPYYQDEGWNRVQVKPTPSDANVNIVHSLNGYPDEYKSNVIYSNAMGVVHNGVASGFSTSNYLNIPKKFPTNSTNFEIVFRFKSNDFSDWQYWFNTAPYYSLLLGTTLGGKIVLYVSNNTSSWDVVDGVQGVTTLDTNTWYYVKCTYNGQAYQVYISRDNINWTQELSVSSTKPVGVAYDGCWIGNGWTGQVGVKTTIDLTQSYIKNNNELWWDGKEYTAVGFWNDEGVVGGFSSSNYAILPSYFSSCSTNFELKTKFYIKNKTSARIFGRWESDLKCGLVIGLDNTNLDALHMWISSNNTSWDIVQNATSTKTINTNTWYWLRLTYNGSNYILSISENNKDWDEYINIASTLQFKQTACSSFGFYSNPFEGLVDLSESYIKINGKMWWNNKTNEYKYWDEDYIPNYTINGSQGKISNGIISGISSGSYLTMPFTPSTLSSANNWEVVTCFTTNSKGIGNFFGGASGTFVPDFGRIVGNHFGLAYSSTGTSYDISGADPLLGTYEVLPNTKYWVRQKFTGSEYTLEYSLNGKDYVQDIIVSSTTKIESTTDVIYCGYSPVRADVYNSLDFNESYVKINGNVLWDGKDYTTVGFWDNESSVSGFGSTTNYLTTQSLPSTPSTYEAVMCFTTPLAFRSGVSSETLGYNSIDYAGQMFYIVGPTASNYSTYNSSLSFVSGGSGTAWGAGSIYSKSPLKTSTKYWAKAVWDGATWFLLLSTDGKHFVLQSSVVGPFGNIPPQHSIGNSLTSWSGTNYFSGTIHLDECYININGKRWWDCQTKNKTNYVTNIKDKEFLTLPNNELRIDVSRDGYDDYFNHYTFTDDTTITPSLTASPEI